MKPIRDITLDDIPDFDSNQMDTDKAFDILCLPKTATKEEINKHYRILAMLTHPDKNPERKDEADKKFKLIAAAKAKADQYLENPTVSGIYQDYFKDFFGKSSATNTAASGTDPKSSIHAEELFKNLKAFFTWRLLLGLYLKIVQLALHYTLGSIHQKIADTLRPYKSDKDRQSDEALWAKGFKILLGCFAVVAIVSFICVVAATIAATVGLICLIKAPIRFLQEICERLTSSHRLEIVVTTDPQKQPPARYTAKQLLKGAYFAGKAIVNLITLGVFLSPFLAMGVIKGTLEFVTYPLVWLIRIPYRKYITQRNGSPNIGENWRIKSLIKKVKSQLVRLKNAKSKKTVDTLKVDMSMNAAHMSLELGINRANGQATNISVEDNARCWLEFQKTLLLVEWTQAGKLENFEACEKATNTFLILFENDRHAPPAPKTAATCKPTLLPQ